MHRTCIICAAFVAIAAQPTLGQEPPTTIQAATVTGTGITHGTFDGAGDVDTYRVQLVQGQDYALGARVLHGDGRFTLKGPTGTVLCSDTSGDSEGWGCEFRAGRDGYFTIEAREDGGAAGSSYSIRINKDCRRDTKSRCRLKPGASLSGPLTYGDDADMIKLTGLTPGRSYTVTLSATITAESQPSSAFKATRKEMWVTVRGLDPYTDGGTYKISVR